MKIYVLSGHLGYLGKKKYISFLFPYIVGIKKTCVKYMVSILRQNYAKKKDVNMQKKYDVIINLYSIFDHNIDLSK